MGQEQSSPAKVRVVLFSGGRGGATIARALVTHPQVELSLLINAYDDGLSTGRLRKYIPGMLGPSDLRKNALTLMPRTERCHAALSALLEVRLPDEIAREAAVSDLRRLVAGEAPELEALRAPLPGLTCGQFQEVRAATEAFLAYEAEEVASGRPPFDYGDCSVGNVAFAGFYLLCERDFNRATARFAALCESRAEVLNVTEGEPLVLVGLKEDGRYLRDESAIVSPQDEVPIREVFLLADYLGAEDQARLEALEGPAARAAFLRAREQTPAARARALEVLEQADLIIYGPGTQHSSLLPSYLTAGIGEAIAGNARATKVFVGNIVHDHDIPGQSVRQLVDRAVHCLNRKGALGNDSARYLTTVFVQRPDDANLQRGPERSYVELESGERPGLQQGVREGDWEEGVGRHAGGVIADTIMDLVAGTFRDKLQPLRHLVSIIVPTLDEAARLGSVLRDLSSVDLSHLGLQTEVLVVDGGSTDGTLEVARSVEGPRLYRLPAGVSGRGRAFRYGVEKARGNVIVVFPGDGEYRAEDLAALVEPIVTNRYQVVFGSRASRITDLSAHIQGIYGEDRLGYLASKYGGISFSLLSLLLYNRFVTDPFCTLKAFDGTLLRSLELQGHGVELEAELIAKLCTRKVCVLEVPVEFRPRTKAEGKKKSVGDGVKTLATLLGARVGLAWRRLRGEDPET